MHFFIEQWLPHYVLLIKHFCPKSFGHGSILHQLSHFLNIDGNAPLQVLIDQHFEFLELEFQVEFLQLVNHLNERH